MSQQIILPKDILIKSLAICVEDEKVPLRLKTKSGKVKSYNKKLLENFAESNSVRTLLSLIEDGFEEEIRSKVPLGVPDDFDCNLSAYILSDEMTSLYESGVRLPLESNGKIEKVYRETTSLMTNRLAKSLGQNATDSYHIKFKESFELFKEYMEIAQCLEETRDLFNNKMSGKKKKWIREGQSEDIKLEEVWSDKRPVKFYQIGNIVFVRVNRGKYVVKSRLHIMTNVHYNRVIDLFKAFSRLSVSIPFLSHINSSSNTIKKLVDMVIKVGISCPNSIGEVLKGAKQICFLRQDKSNIMGKGAADWYIDDLSGMREKYSIKIADDVSSMFGSLIDAQNLLNIYKLVLHPDAPMAEVFDTIVGVKEPNRVNPDILDRFDGIMRRNIFMSLTRQNITVLADPLDIEDEVSKSFTERINATQKSVSSLAKSKFTLWSGVRFREVEGYFNEKHHDIKPANKTSAPNKTITKAFLKKLGDTKSLTEYMEAKQTLIGTNDIVSDMKGDDEGDFVQARKRFETVVKLHEKFEDSWRNDGVDIDDIPSEELEKFLLDNPDASYLVLTEPKLGETHKTLTRLFYMAQRALKVMTQTSERVAKQAIGKQVGVSITKDYKARRKELEDMANAYTDIPENDSNEADPFVVFVSFDMAEFSKKFPMILVRKAGSILAEITGEDWLRRVDLFFRSSHVFHNTRNFIGSIAGVRGGFEGFLNFLWTSIMAVILEISIEATGLEGVHAAYSDDGVMRLYFNCPKDEIKGKLFSVQTIFDNFGLKFKFSKTAASAQIFEYLGEMSVRGVLTDSWIKGVCAMGLRKNTPGVEFLYDIITLWNSQARAISAFGGHPILCDFLNIYLSLDTLSYRYPNHKMDHLAMLLIIPPGAGGFRVPSITERSGTSSITTLSEFAADLELLHERYPAYVECITNRILDNLKVGKEAENGVLTGSLLQTTIGDNSGISLITELHDKVSGKFDVPKNPMTEHIRKQLIEGLKSHNSSNISPKLINTIITSVPDVVEYNTSVAMLKSTAALKFVSRDEIKKVQWKNRRSEDRNVAKWSKELLKYKSSGMDVRSRVFIQKILGISYKNFSIKSLIESPRVALKKVSKDPDIIVHNEFIEKNFKRDQIHREPPKMFLGQQLSPEFAAEGSSDTKQRRIRKFVNNISRVVSTSPSTINFYYIIANAFRLPIPAINPTLITSAHRSPKNFGLNAVIVDIPSPYRGTITSRMTNKLWNNLRNKERCDRTTYVEFARLLAMIDIDSVYDESVLINCKSDSCYYVVRDLEYNIIYEDQMGRIRPNVDLYDDSATKAFNSTIIEENRHRRELSNYIMSNDLNNLQLDNYMVYGLHLVIYERWLYSAIQDDTFKGYKPASITLPESYRIRIMSDAAFSVAFRSLSSAERTNIIRSFIRLMSDEHIISPKYCLDSVNFRDSLSDSISRGTLQYSYPILKDKIESIYEMYRSGEPDDNIINAFSDYDLGNDRELRSMVDYFSKQSLEEIETEKSVVITTENFKDSNMSPSTKEQIKSYITYRLRSYEVDTSRNIDHDVFTNTFQINRILIMYIIKDLIRASGHRKLRSPFNATMAAIEFIKVRRFINRLMENECDDFYLREANDFRIGGKLTSHITRTSGELGMKMATGRAKDFIETLGGKGIMGNLITPIQKVISGKYGDYYYKDASEENLCTNLRLIQSYREAVLGVYQAFSHKIAKGLHIIHSRTVDYLSKNSFVTPVEEVSWIRSEIRDGCISGYGVDISNILSSTDKKCLLLSLFQLHSARWGIDGYRTGTQFDKELRGIGMFDGGGIEVLLSSRLCNERFSISKTDRTQAGVVVCEDSKAARENYILINKVEGAMGLICKEDETFQIYYILPPNVRVFNGSYQNNMVISEDETMKIPIYNTTKVSSNLTSMLSYLNMRSANTVRKEEKDFYQFSSAFRRAVSSSIHIEEEDAFLVALDHIVTGTWSLASGMRVYAGIIAWLKKGINVEPCDLKDEIRSIESAISDSDNEVYTKIMMDISNVWLWVKGSKIVQGAGVSSNMVSRMVKTLSKIKCSDGAPTSACLLKRKSVRQVKEAERISYLTYGDVYFKLYHALEKRDSHKLNLYLDIESMSDDWESASDDSLRYFTEDEYKERYLR